MTSKQRWLETGLKLLASEGITALRIERLAESLNLSKGSFYHHFAGMSAYRLDVLDYYEATSTTSHIALVEADGDLSPRQKLDRLRQSVFADDDDPSLDIAMRAWATQDDDAGAMQERVDARRLGYLQTLCEESTGDQAVALNASRMIYLLLIGAQHVMPPLPMREVNRLYDVVLAQLDATVAR